MKRLLITGAVAVAVVIAAVGLWLQNRDTLAYESMTKLTAEEIESISFGVYMLDGEEPSWPQHMLSAEETDLVLASFSSLEKENFRRVGLHGMTVPAEYYLYITLTEGRQLIINGTKEEGTYDLICNAAPKQGKVSYYLVEIPCLVPLFDALSHTV